jgi:hypothetical protein
VKDFVDTNKVTVVVIGMGDPAKRSKLGRARVCARIYAQKFVAYSFVKIQKSMSCVRACQVVARQFPKTVNYCLNLLFLETIVSNFRSWKL